VSPVKYEVFFSYITLTGWTLQWRSHMSPVKYEMCYISQKATFFIVTAVKTSNLTMPTVLLEDTFYKKGLN
jgi:hypothetical protein